jgi:hypothetical protein
VPLLPHPIRATWPAQLILHDLITILGSTNEIWWQKKWLFTATECVSLPWNMFRYSVILWSVISLIQVKGQTGETKSSVNCARRKILRNKI